MQKQILFAFCRGEVSKTKSKITNKPSAKANFYLHFAEAKYLRRSQRLRISRVQKQIFICILPRRSIQNEVKDTKIPLSFVRKKRRQHGSSEKSTRYRTCSLFAPDKTQRGASRFRELLADTLSENTTGQPSERESHRIVRDRAPATPTAPLP